MTGAIFVSSCLLAQHNGLVKRDRIINAVLTVYQVDLAFLSKKTVEVEVFEGSQGRTYKIPFVQDRFDDADVEIGQIEVAFVFGYKPVDYWLLFDNVV
jgi:hypothetical protein